MLKKILLALLLFSILLTSAQLKVSAQPFAPEPAQNIDALPVANTPLAAEKAFQFSASARDYQTVLLKWQMAKGYYLYREHIQICATHPESTRLGQPIFPLATEKNIPEVGQLALYENTVVIPVPVISHPGDQVMLNVHYQGCSSSGYCYPPMAKMVLVNLTKNYGQSVTGIAIDATPTTDAPPPDKLTQLLSGAHPAIVLLTFLGFGILVSFTPCVLPMVPILSSIILGQKKMTHWHAFLLSLAYVLGMAVTYAIAGMLFGYLGATLQAIMQRPWIIVLFSLLFIAMALALFGLYNLQLPESLRNRLAHMSEHQKHGTYLGVFVMGCLSTLILSPCVTAPLVAVLGYISKTGNAAFGGVALFSMGIGMGLPLLLIGATSTRLLPKAGPWMQQIEVLMGVLLLALAIFMIGRIVPDLAGNLLWTALLLGYGVYLGAFSSISGDITPVRKAFGIAILLYGSLMLLGIASQSDNPWNPLRLVKKAQPSASSHFTTVRTLDELKQALRLAKQAKDPVLIDFFADWCVSCKMMDKQLFENATVLEKLKGFRMLRVDVSANRYSDQEMMRYFNVIAPPTLLLLNPEQKKQHTRRIVGEVTVNEFLKQLNQE